VTSFEFFFSFYGLILGLSVVEVITGFARAVKGRHRVRVGYVTPMMGLIVLLDLASFWRNAWTSMQHVPVSLITLLIGLAIAGVYFLAASLIFPDDLDAWPRFDDFYDKHKAWVIGGVWSANMLAVFGLMAFLATPGEYWAAALQPRNLANMGLHSGLAIAQVGLRNHRVNAAIMVLDAVLYFV
jgi:hypothetical protein